MTDGKITDVLPTLVAFGLTVKVVDEFTKRQKKAEKRKKMKEVI